MNFLELTKKRYSVRSYTSQEVEKEKSDYILECARYAPSAVNKQPWQFIVIQSELQKAAKGLPCQMVCGSPLIYHCMC